MIWTRSSPTRKTADEGHQLQADGRLRPRGGSAGAATTPTASLAAASPAHREGGHASDARTRGWSGCLFLPPALLFVARVHGSIPLVPMIWVSFHNWSLITAARSSSGSANFDADVQRRASSGCRCCSRLKYTPAHHADPHGRRLPARAADRRPNSPLRRIDPDHRSSSRSSSASGCRACCGTGCSARSYGFDQRDRCSTSALIDEPVLWLGVDADRSNCGRSSARSPGR